MPSILRFTGGGILDPTFGSGGISTVTMPFPSGGSAAWFSDLVLLPDGRIVAVGNAYDPTQNAFIIARFLPQVGTTSVAAWGWNGVGQLGDGTTADRGRPAVISNLRDVVAVGAGAYHTLALRGDGTVWAWGWNAVGQLGDGTTVDRARPVQVPGLTGVVAISAGAFHSLALLGGGTVRAWGGTTSGSLATVRRSTAPLRWPWLISTVSSALPPAGSTASP